MTQHDATTYCPGCRELWSTLPALHFCAAPETPQSAHSADSDAAIPGSVPRHCCVCGKAVSVNMATSPVCPDHASPNALTAALAEARAERDAARVVLGQASALLRDMEWGDTNVFGIDINNDACLVCGSRRHMGHRPDCELLPLVTLLAGAS